MFKLLKIAQKEDPRRPRSTRRRRRRIPGAAGGRSVIDHAASTQSVIINNEIYEHIYVRLEKIDIYLSIICIIIPDGHNRFIFAVKAGCHFDAMLGDKCSISLKVPSL